MPATSPTPPPPARLDPIGAPAPIPGPLDGLEQCPVTPDGWILPPPGYPWKVSRRHYIFWEAVLAINYLWIAAACYNINMTALWSTLPVILWLLVVVRGSVLFTSLYGRVCSAGMSTLVVASYSANFVLTLILLSHMLLSGAQYSPISIFTAFELLFELFVLAVVQLPAYRWPLRYWMLRREPVLNPPAAGVGAAAPSAGQPDDEGRVTPATP
ncbi:MAG TPA: hypothetical protein VL860_07885 [Planctomycetota bacterium]|nr:hypothetical protein [Planctomycetota bacterium]